MSSERPKKLSAEALEQYNALLDEQSFPFEEQAIAIHEINAKRVLDGVYDDSVRASFKALAELKPARYGKTELSVGGVATLSPPAQAIAASPDAVVAQTHRDGSLEDSEQALKRATALDPSNALAWTELGVTLRQQGKFADARAAYEHALAANPDYAPAHRNLGVLLDLYLGDPAAALPEMERYKALTAEDKPVSSWIAELRARTGVKPPAAPTPAAAADPDPPGTTAANDHGGPTT
jgi:Flp pilus assembly protein TadD